MSVRHVRTCIQASLGVLSKQALELEAMNATLQAYLPLSLFQRVFVVSFTQGCLTLGVHDAAWLTELRYESSRLRDVLRREAKWYGLGSIQLKVIQPEARKAKKKSTKKNTVEAHQAICQALEDLAR